MKSFNNEYAAHRYEVEVGFGRDHGIIEHIKVDADNRDDAAELATFLGYNVRSVNMIG